jgi:hypothetical protein
MKTLTVTFEGSKELEVLAWALEDLFEVEEKEALKHSNPEQDLFCDRIFALLERVRKARNS